MEVIIPSHSLEFDFNSARSSPHVTAPSTPRRFGDYYFSAPTSPSHISQFYKDFDEFLFASDDDGGGGGGGRLPSSVPFDWEEKPGTPKTSLLVDDNGDDFAFDVNQDWETASLSAEELFDGGVIKPLKPPPRMQIPAAEAGSRDTAASPLRKQRSQTRKMFQGAFSPRHRNNRDTDPFAVAARNTVKEPPLPPPQRGRERGTALSRPPSRRVARSLSPLRDVPNLLEEDEKEPPQNGKHFPCSAISAPSKAQKKWSFKDFFLFRSASEGRASDKDPLKKYTASFRRSSFSVMDSPGSGHGSKRRGPVSAHELHYTVNRAVSEDLKKKTFLPYKQGILGRLAFNPAVHALANGFGLSRR